MPAGVFAQEVITIGVEGATYVIGPVALVIVPGDDGILNPRGPRTGNTSTVVSL